MEISGILRKWYLDNRRDLPWRETKDPYNIWISEIILQQTRVEQGTGYYKRFIQKFPDLLSLASADIDEVLKIWQGLGYYTRARNLHQAAGQIMETHAGIFPSNFNDIIRLKGIGKYTAGAIASIAFNLPVPAIDGNVKRIFCRFFGFGENPNSGKGKSIIEGLVMETLDTKHPGDFNQSLMDFGSLVCKPGNPDCAHCPLAQKCYAFNENKLSDYPAASKKIKSRTRYFYYLVLIQNKNFFIEQRMESDIWKRLYQFPLIEGDKGLNRQALMYEIKKKFLQIAASSSSKIANTLEELEVLNISEEHRHILSHQKILARFIEIKINEGELSGLIFSHTDWKMIPFTDIHNYALPRLIEKFANNFISLQFKQQ